MLKTLGRYGGWFGKNMIVYTCWYWQHRCPPRRTLGLNESHLLVPSVLVQYSHNDGSSAVLPYQMFLNILSRRSTATMNIADRQTTNKMPSHWIMVQQFLLVTLLTSVQKSQWIVRLFFWDVLRLSCHETRINFHD
jgi:hypothetical protein